MTHSRSITLALAAVAATATIGAGGGAAPANASGGTPLAGELCRARENIYIGSGSSRYTVHAGGNIRIVWAGKGWDEGGVAYGRGTGMHEGYFTWKHYYGPTRVFDCR